MSCQKSTSPINIFNGNNVLNCRGKCNLNYDYNLTNIISTNRRYFLEIDLANKSNTVVNYSTNTRGTKCNTQGGDYILNQMRIYHPSVHTYNNERANAELIIEHKNIMGGNDLLICIPISTSSGILPQASMQLRQLIDYMSRVGNAPGQGGNIPGLNLNLNNFIPDNKGFFTYSASLPYTPCTNCVIFIVYDLNEVAINIQPDTLKKLKSIIQPKKFPIRPFNSGLGLAYNSAGATRNSGSLGDEIWIDCQPTGSDGQILLNEKKDSNSASVPNSSDVVNDVTNFFKSKWGNILIGILLVLLVYYIVGNIKSKILSQKGGNPTKIEVNNSIK